MVKKQKKLRKLISLSELKIVKGKVDIHDLREMILDWYLCLDDQDDKYTKEFLMDKFEFYVDEVRNGEVDRKWGDGLWK